MDSNNTHIHNFKKIVVPATCQKAGYTLNKCECGYEHKDNFTPIGEHSFKVIKETPSTCIEPGKVQIVCDICGETKNDTLPPIGHDYSDWSIQTHPTCTEPGKQIRVCRRCGRIDENIIEAMGHSPVEGTERHVDSGMMEFFCKNCGETIRCSDKSKKTQKKIKLIAISAAALLVSIVLMLVVWNVLLPNYHYHLAKKYALEAEHNKSYEHYYTLKKMSPDSTLLEDFIVVYANLKENETWYSEDDKMSIKWQHQNEYVYEYDECGNTVLELFYQDGDLYWKYEFKYVYDENNNVVVKTTWNQDDEIAYRDEYVYDENNNVVIENTYDKHGTLDYSHTYEYNDDNKLVKKLFLSDDGSIITKYEYTYNAGYLASEVWYDSNDTMERVFEFDDQGNMLTQACYDDNGDILWKNSYEYKYNEKTEVTKIMVYNIDGQLESESIIEYQDFFVFYSPNK